MIISTKKTPFRNKTKAASSDNSKNAALWDDDKSVNIHCPTIVKRCLRQYGAVQQHR